MDRRISVRAIILHEGKLFCVKQRSYNELASSINGHWNLPGGGLDENEGLIDCLQREMIEETGIKAIPGNLMYIQQFSYNDTEYLEFFFHVTNTADYLHIDLSKTTHGEAEIAEFGFIDPTTAEILPKFLTREPLSEKIHAATTIFSLL